jgi:hypothetical protein
MVGNASGIDLNNASVNQLSRIGGIGPVLAARIVEHRPFRRWVELEEIAGFTHELVNDLRGSGAKLGSPGPASKPKKPYSRVLQPPQTPANQVANARRKGKTRQVKSIFSGKGQAGE